MREDECGENLQVKIARLEERITARDEAIRLFREGLDAYKLANNEWRAENIDQRSLFMTIDKAIALLSVEASLRGALEGRVRMLEDSGKLITGKNSAANTTWVIASFIITLGISVVAIFFK